MQIINRIVRRIIPAAAVAIALHLGACTETLVVYDHTDVEIGLAPVNRISTKMLSGSMEGTAYDYMESFGILAWYQDTPEGQSWTDFYDAGDAPSPYITNSGTEAAVLGVGCVVAFVVSPPACHKKRTARGAVRLRRGGGA